MAEIWCPTCRAVHGNATEPHPYDPDRRRPYDPVGGQPCRECGRFRGSYLHTEGDHHHA